MSFFKSVLVGLDITEMDEQLIAYTAFLCTLIQPEKICFLNVQHDLDLPEPIQTSYPALREPLDEQIRRKMENQVRQGFPAYEAFNISYEVAEGNPRKEILDYVETKQADLLVVGRKHGSHGGGITPQQLARKVSCSLLIVPENSETRISHILIATDFSPYSYAALEQAREIAQAIPGAAIRCQHVYTVPYGYHKTGLTEPEFAAIMHQNAMDSYDKFLHSLPKTSVETLEPIFTYDPSRQSPAVVIHAEAHQLDADLLVVGARGLNAAAAFLLGSVADKLLQLEHDIPLLIVKDES